MKHVIVTLGHEPGVDPGAKQGNVYGEVFEVDKIAAVLLILTNSDLYKQGKIVILPWTNLNQDIKNVNSKTTKESVCAVDIHFDTGSYSKSLVNKGYHGIYYGGKTSQNYAQMISGYINKRAGVDQGWNRSHTQSRFGKLGFVNLIKIPSMVLEVGYISAEPEDMANVVAGFLDFVNEVTSS